jgi:hypothetical protein
MLNWREDQYIRTAQTKNLMFEPAILPHPPEVLDKKVVTPYITLWMDAEGFLCARYADDLHLTLEVATAIVESRIYFAKGNSYPVLVDMRGIKSTTKKAREYMATIGSTRVTAGALITGSPWNRTLGNLFLTIDKPEVPTRLFTNELSARLWLKQYL